MHKPLTALALLASLGITSNAHAFALDDCYANVEALNAAMEQETELPERAVNEIDTQINAAITACEKGKMSEGEQAITDANRLYEAAVAELYGDVTPAEFWAKADYTWGNRSHLKNVEYTMGTISCDDKLDYVAWRMDLDNPDNPGLDVLAVTKNDLGDIKTAYTTFPLDGSQYGICHMEGSTPTVEVTLDEQVADLFEPGELGVDVCPQVIRVDDGMCDSIRLMWPQDDQGDEVEFLLFRN